MELTKRQELMTVKRSDAAWHAAAISFPPTQLPVHDSLFTPPTLPAVIVVSQAAQPDRLSPQKLVSIFFRPTNHATEHELWRQVQNEVISDTTQTLNPKP